MPFPATISPRVVDEAAARQAFCELQLGRLLLASSFFEATYCASAALENGADQAVVFDLLEDWGRKHLPPMVLGSRVTER